MTALTSVLSRASIILNDTSNVRWTSAELVLWANDGIKEIVQLDPPAIQKHVTTTLVAGAMQTLPDEAIMLIDVVGNVLSGGGAGTQIRMCNRGDLDARFPAWQMDTAATSVANVMYDPKDRKTFWVYPVISAGTKIEVVYSYAPVDVDSTGTIPLDIQYHGALLNYILHRAFSKEGEQQGSAARAMAHYQMFSATLTAIISNRTGGSVKEGE